MVILEKPLGLSGGEASLRAYVGFEHAALCDFVQEQHNELRGIIASQN